MLLRIVVALALLAAATGGFALEEQTAIAAAAVESPEEAAIRKLIADYARAIESKDLGLFKTVKPSLTADEEKRAKAAFSSIQSQVVKIVFVSIDVKEHQAVVKVTRRDTINGSIPGAFPQTFNLSKGRSGWVIDEIGR
jgi:hypothetical protein